MLRSMLLRMRHGVLRCVLGMCRRMGAGCRTLPLSRGRSWRRSRRRLLGLLRLRLWLGSMRHALLNWRSNMMLLVLRMRLSVLLVRLLVLLLERLLRVVLPKVHSLGLVASSHVGLLLLVVSMASAVPSRMAVVSKRILLWWLLHLLLVLQRWH